jgi:hypothetical protein
MPGVTWPGGELDDVAPARTPLIVWALIALGVVAATAGALVAGLGGNTTVEWLGVALIVIGVVALLAALGATDVGRRSERSGRSADLATGLAIASLTVAGLLAGFAVFGRISPL